MINKTLLRNAVFNLLGNGSSLLIVVLLPKILLPVFGKVEYGVLALVLNLSTYIIFFSLGIQTALAKYVAQTDASRDYREQLEYLNAAFIILFGSVCLGILFTILASLIMPHYMLPSGVTVDLKSNFIISILCFGVITSLSLFYNVYAGYFIGVLRNHFFSITQFILRLLTLLIIYYAVSYYEIHSLLFVVTIIATGSFLLVPILAFNFIFVRNNVVHKIIAFKIYSIDKLKSILKFCLQLSIWNFAMLLVSSTSLYVVGYFDFNHVTEFSLAVILINAMVGIIGSASAPLVPYFSGLFEQRSTNIKSIIIKLTWILIVFSIVVIAIFFLFGHWLIQMLFGVKFVTMVYSLTSLLGVSFILRNLLLPLSVFLVSSNQQYLGVKVVLIEGLTNVIASILFGYFYGSIGVAIGSIAGSIIGVMFCLMMVVPKVRYINV